MPTDPSFFGPTLKFLGTSKIFFLSFKDIMKDFHSLPIEKKSPKNLPTYQPLKILR